MKDLDSKQGLKDEFSSQVIYKNGLVYIIFILFIGLVPISNSNTWADQGKRDTGSSTSSVRLETIQEWKSYVQDIWFYDQDMEKVIPEPSFDWLVVKLTGLEDPDGSGLPDQIKDMNSRLKDHISHYIYNPSVSEGLVAYELATGTSREVRLFLDKLKAQGQVDYVHPALRIDGRLHATLNKINIKWKSSLSQEARRMLLSRIKAKEFSYLLPKDTEQIHVKGDDIPVWQAANILAEDIYTVYASPVIFKLREPIKCNLKVQMPGGNIGTPIHFSLEIILQDDLRLYPGSIVNMDLAPENISRSLIDIRYEKALSTIDLGKSPINISGQIYIYTPGDFMLPQIPIVYKYKVNDKTRLQKVTTQPVSLHITSLIPKASSKHSLRTAGIDTKLEAFEQVRKGAWSYLTASILFSILAGLSLLYLYLNLQKMKKGRAGDTPGQTVQSYDYLLEFCLKDVNEFNINDIAILIKTLRGYVMQAYNVPKTHSGGSTEIFTKNIAGYVPESLNQTFYSIESGLADMLARQEIDQDRLKDSLKSLQKFIDLVQEDLSKALED